MNSVGGAEVLDRLLEQIGALSSEIHSFQKASILQTQELKASIDLLRAEVTGRERVTEHRLNAIEAQLVQRAAAASVAAVEQRVASVEAAIAEQQRASASAMERWIPIVVSVLSVLGTAGMTIWSWRRP